MSASILEYLPNGQEPLSLLQIRAQVRLDGDITEDDAWLESFAIPTARGWAESRSGSAIRPARYVETVQDMSVALGRGQVLEVERVAVAGVDLDAAAWTVETVGRRTGIVAPTVVGSATVTFTAGILNHELYPGVVAWIALAAAWLYNNRELFASGAIQEMPRSHADSLLQPIMVPDPF